MTFEEIIRRLGEKDEEVTSCFFFWDGPTLERIESVRRTNPYAAAKMRRPVCNTCRPLLLNVLHKLYGSAGFDYNRLVSDFYYYIMKDNKLSTINNPDALMGWMARTAYFFFLHTKEKEDSLLENCPIDALNAEQIDTAASDDRTEIKDFVSEVIAAMPNRVYAKLLEDVVLEVAQYSGKEKSELLRRKAEELQIPVDNLYVKISLAKKQFKSVAMKLKNN